MFTDLDEELLQLGFQNTWEASRDSFEHRRSFLAQEAKAYHQSREYKELKKELNRAHYLSVTKPTRERERRYRELARDVSEISSGVEKLFWAYLRRPIGTYNSRKTRLN